MYSICQSVFEHDYESMTEFKYEMGQSKNLGYEICDTCLINCEILKILVFRSFFD